jgi:hypothetical protein
MATTPDPTPAAAPQKGIVAVVAQRAMSDVLSLDPATRLQLYGGAAAAIAVAARGLAASVPGWLRGTRSDAPAPTVVALGDDARNPIPVPDLPAEYADLERRFGRRGEGWLLLQQALYRVPGTNGTVDGLTIRLRDGATRTVYYLPTALAAAPPGAPQAPQPQPQPPSSAPQPTAPAGAAIGVRSWCDPLPSGSPGRSTNAGWAMLEHHGGATLMDYAIRGAPAPTQPAGSAVAPAGDAVRQPGDDDCMWGYRQYMEGTEFRASVQAGRPISFPEWAARTGCQGTRLAPEPPPDATLPLGACMPPPGGFGSELERQAWIAGHPRCPPPSPDAVTPRGGGAAAVVGGVFVGVLLAALLPKPRVL